jgi:hypothetical protein
MSPRTIFLGRLIGIYAILVSLAMMANRQATLDMVTALFHSPPVLFLAAIIAVSVGLALVLGHNIWSGGGVTVIVTLLGWLTLLKGLLLLFLPQLEALEFFLDALRYERLFYMYAGISLLLGLYLTVAASKTRGQRSEPGPRVAASFAV